MCSGLCVCMLQCLLIINATLLHLSPLERIVQENDYDYVCSRNKLSLTPYDIDQI